MNKTDLHTILSQMNTPHMDEYIKSVREGKTVKVKFDYFSKEKDKYALTSTLKIYLRIFHVTKCVFGKVTLETLIKRTSYRNTSSVSKYLDDKPALFNKVNDQEYELTEKGIELAKTFIKACINNDEVS